MIYDCFVFFNELDILELRLSLYDKYVDYFVICECSHTQKGIKKDFVLENNLDRFSKYKNKIIYLKADNPPVEKLKNDSWAIEFYQRNYLIKGLIKCNDNDFIFLSDIDEFWNPCLIKNFNQCIVKLVDINTGIRNYLGMHKFHLLNSPNLLFHKKVDYFLSKSPLAIEQDFFYYFFNYKWEKKWHGTIVSLYKNINTLQDLRNRRNTLPYITCKKFKTGWHFSYLGGKDKIKEKLSSIVEGSLCKVDNIDEWIDYCLQNHQDLFNRTSDNLNIVKLEDIGLNEIYSWIEAYPKFILSPKTQTT